MIMMTMSMTMMIIIIIKGKVTKKSALQKTKRFTYMKLTLQDGKYFYGFDVSFSMILKPMKAFTKVTFSCF